MNLKQMVAGILKDAHNLERYTKELGEINKGNLNPRLCKEDCEMCGGSGKVAEFELDKDGLPTEYGESTCPNLLEEWDNTPDHDNCN